MRFNPCCTLVPYWFFVKIIILFFTFSIVVANPDDPFKGLLAISVTAPTYQKFIHVNRILSQYGPLQQLSEDTFRVIKDILFAVSPLQLEKLSNLKPKNVDIHIISYDLAKLIRQSPQQQNNYLSQKQNLISLRSDNNNQQSQFYLQFHTWTDYQIKWKEIATMYSSHVQLIEIGKTWENRPIHAFIIGSNQTEKKIFLNGMQHAREWIAAAVPTYIAETLAKAATAQSNDLNLVEYMKQVQVIIVPIVNPDGYVFTHKHNRNWRKNKRPNTICDGVDLNRNWAIDFAGPFATSSDPCNELYYGPNAFSEPETKALQKLVSHYGPFLAHFDFHAYGQYILGPWSYKDDIPPRVKEIDALGNALTILMAKSSGSTYQYDRGANNSLLYPASGIMADWMFSKGTMSFTIELRPNSNNIMQFALSEDEILPTCQESLIAVKVLLRFAVEPDKIVEEYSKKEDFVQPPPKPVSVSVDDSQQTIEGNKKTSGGNGMDIPFIAGISVGVVVLVSVIVMIIVLVSIQRNRT